MTALETTPRALDAPLLPPLATPAAPGHRARRSREHPAAQRASAPRPGAQRAAATARPARHRRRESASTRYLILAFLGVWATVVLAAPHLHASPLVHQVALFCHLAALVLGFGAVLTLDWFGLMWALRRSSLATVMQVAHGVHTPIWLGLAGLTASGMVLSPNTSAPLTMVKLLAVLAVAINGLYARRVQERMAELGEGPPPLSLLARGAAAVMISQAGWWTATAVGFLNAQS
jgi:hypothetical protein